MHQYQIVHMKLYAKHPQQFTLRNYQTQFQISNQQKNMSRDSADKTNFQIFKD